MFKPVFAEFQHRAQMLVGNENRRLDPWLFNRSDVDGIWHVRGIVQFLHAAVVQMDAVDD